MSGSPAATCGVHGREPDRSGDRARALLPRNGWEPGPKLGVSGPVTEPSASTVADDRLMARVQTGDVEAFALLYKKYCVCAYRIAYAMCGDHDCAEDAVQEGFFSVWASRDHYRPETAGASSWILTMVRRRAIDGIRRDSRHAARREPEGALEARAAITDVASEAIGHADVAGLQGPLALLPETQREVITLAFYGQLSHSEISTYLRLPPGTVKGRMRLGLHKLRAELDS